MDLRELRYFEATYELESISAAAKHCFVSQPSISAAIQSLEQHLGESLFIRHPRGVLPTDAGHKLYPLSKQLTGQARSIKQLFQEKSAIQPFRLGVVQALGAARMSHLLKEMIDAVDGLELTLVDAEKKGYDARIVSSNMVRPDEAFLPFWRDEFLMALPVGHPLSYKSQLELMDLNGLNFILRSPSLVTKTLMREMEPLGVRMNIRARIRTVEYAVELVAAGVGAAIVPDHPSFFHTTKLPLLKVADHQFDRIIGLAWPRDKKQEGVLAAMINVCEVNKIEHFDWSKWIVK